ncbi:hypothetical protein Pcinc_021482 [Petrolisthes cinctipes]|uniref:Uncharacterized protein n=1 Tax=Petrolisthes cinctipes TaxID=88211 RepID=A0AAE1FH45_PETCI|nr:hypothetical protein Pcinc_021482 [Petrolisthes cinctipes]
MWRECGWWTTGSDVGEAVVNAWSQERWGWSTVSEEGGWLWFGWMKESGGVGGWKGNGVGLGQGDGEKWVGESEHGGGRGGVGMRLDMVRVGEGERGVGDEVRLGRGKGAMWVEGGRVVEGVRGCLGSNVGGVGGGEKVGGGCVDDGVGRICDGGMWLGEGEHEGEEGKG